MRQSALAIPAFANHSIARLPSHTPIYNDSPARDDAATLLFDAQRHTCGVDVGLASHVLSPYEDALILVVLYSWTAFGPPHNSYRLPAQGMLHWFEVFDRLAPFERPEAQKHCEPYSSAAYA